MDKAYFFQFQNEEDIAKWKWCGKGKYTTKSMYDHLTKDDAVNSYQYIWKSKIPYKIKIFTWLVANNAIPTKDNMKRRNWEGSPICTFCDQVETVDHLFFQCSIAKCVWGIVAASMGATTIPGDSRQYRP
jgi:hypothetical protein